MLNYKKIAQMTYSRDRSASWNGQYGSVIPVDLGVQPMLQCRGMCLCVDLIVIQTIIVINIIAVVSSLLTRRTWSRKKTGCSKGGEKFVSKLTLLKRKRSCRKMS